MVVRSVTLSESMDSPAIHLTAAQRGHDTRVVLRPNAGKLLPPPPEEAPPRDLLFFLHGFRHRDEWLVNAAALRLSSREQALVETHLLLYCNDASASTGFLVHAMKQYPQRTRYLLHTGVNIGYRCGHIHALGVTQRIWRRFRTVVFTHPDVFLLPPAPMKLLEAVEANDASAFFASETRMFWFGKHKTLAYLSDLFAFRTAELIAQSATTQEAPPRSYRLSNGSMAYCGAKWLRGAPEEVAVAWSTFWSNASDDCACSYWEGRGMLKPEAALHRAQTRLNVSYKPLGLVRTTGWNRQKLSKSGVWHTHNTSQVKSVIEQWPSPQLS